MTPKQVDKEARRLAIIRAAMTLFSTKGLTGTTIQEIAEEANIGKGTVYEYFDSKDALLGSAFDHLMEEMGQYFQEIIESEQSPSIKLQSLFTGMMEFMEQTPGDVAEMLLVFWAEGILKNPAKNAGEMPGHYDLKSLYSEYSAIIVDIIEEGKETGEFREDINSQHMASAIVGSLDGLMLQWVIFEKSFSLESIAESYADIVLNGARER